MSEKLVVMISYALEDEAIKKDALEKGIHNDKVQVTTIEFSEFDETLREKIYQKYYKKDCIINMDITDRSSIARKTEKDIELFHEKLADKKKIKTIIKEYFELKELEDAYFERIMKENEEIRKLRKIESDTMPKMVIRYPISETFAKEMLIKEKKLIKQSCEFSISTGKIKNELLEKAYKHGTVEEEKDYDGPKNVLRVTLFSTDMNGHHFDSYFTEENVNERLSFYFGYQEREKNEKVDGKTSWIEQHGTDYLKRAYRLQYDCQRMYVEERAKKEFPEYQLDFNKNIHFKDRVCPSETALDIEEKLREEHLGLNVRIKWLDRGEFLGEAVVIQEYLEKYTLYKRIEETNER